MSDGLEKHGTTISVALVVGAAAVASVDHLADVARLAGSIGWRIWLLPAAVDGLVAASTLTLRRAHRLGVSSGWVPWASLVAGLAASVVGNVVAVHPDIIHPDDLKVAVGATPPLALALALHQALYRPTRPAEPPAPPPAPAPTPVPEPKPAPIPPPRELPAPPKVNGSHPAPVNGKAPDRAEQLLPLGRKIVDEHGKVPSWKALQDAVKAAGEKCGTGTAQGLHTLLVEEAQD